LMLECGILGYEGCPHEQRSGTEWLGGARREPAWRIRRDRDFHHPVAGRRRIWSHIGSRRDAPSA
jgi:hypothetical protein